MTDLATIDADTGELVEVRPPGTLFRTDDPAEILGKATNVANQLVAVVRAKKLVVKIGQGEHAKVEAWTLLGSLLGVFPVCTWTRKLEDGWEARVEARTMAGVVVGAAEAECLRSERTWSGRDDYALRSMAQTRATSKALRQPLGFVMVLAGFDATPFEEMPRPEPAGASTGASSSVPSAGSEGGNDSAFVAPAPKTHLAAEYLLPSGKHQGQTLAEAPHNYLEWYLANGPRDDVKEAIRIYLNDEPLPF